MKSTWREQMKIKNKAVQLIVSIFILLAFIAQSISPIAVVVNAAENSKFPVPIVSEQKLYIGYKDYTIEFNNLEKNATITYKSNNTKVASVSNEGVIKPVSVGSAIITVVIKQEKAKYTSKITVEVDLPHISITDYMSDFDYGEKYTLVGEAFGIDNASLSWSSSNPMVASIDEGSGALEGLSAGTSTITLKEASTGYTTQVDIRIGEKYTPPIGSEKAVYISGLDLSKGNGTYYTTTQEEYIETTRFILYLDKGVEIPVKVIDLINHAMDQIEDTTGYHFYVPRLNQFIYETGMDFEIKKFFDTADKLIALDTNREIVKIVVANDKKVNPYTEGARGILLSSEDMKLLDGKATALVHELLHVAWQRNGEFMGINLYEGFAVYYAEQIFKDDKVLSSDYNTHEKMSEYELLITEANMEDVFLNTEAENGRYKLGYRITSYIIEKYGQTAYRRLHDKVTDLYHGNDEIPLTLVAKTLKSELSTNFFEEYAVWQNNNRDRFGDKDLSTMSDWDITYNTINKYHGKDSKIVIPDTVQYIDYEAFINCKMDSVVIPDKVIEIRDAAFCGCKKLTEVVIPDSVVDIGASAFDKCTSLKGVVLPKKLQTLNIGVFYGCTSLSNIELPEGLTSIQAEAFFGCTALKSITIPSTLKEMGSWIFYNCTSLESIVIPNGVKEVPECMFYNCTSLKKVVLSKNIKIINEDTFRGCSSLTQIVLPEGLTTIEREAFNLAGLTTITIPDTVTKISDFAFANNKNLKIIIIPKSVKSIGKETFYGCSKLVIYCKKGSYAEKYAKEHKIKFQSN